ncbi:hypothetical protein GCM10023196_032800 [Actinoallomurus vinaceus]|uniref:Uncharacterized protein n=1 Tax=Actinoallomurus vinaceus TaxID=1080074 RepID=A0ABP8U808_9ACTN
MGFRRGLAGLAEPLPAEDARLGGRGLGLSAPVTHPTGAPATEARASTRQPVSPLGVRPGFEALSELYFEFFLAPGAEALIAPYRPPVPGAPQPEPPARIIGRELLELTGRSLDSVLHVHLSRTSHTASRGDPRHGRRKSFPVRRRFDHMAESGQGNHGEVL